MRLIIPLVLLAVTASAIAFAQDGDNSKAIRAEEFIEKRPTRSRRPAPDKYRAATKTNEVIPDVPPAGMTFAELGITLWRFRPSTAADTTKELLEVEGESKEVTLERIKVGTPVFPLQRIRFSIESLSREGYLYVINREKYSDGTFGEPLLIFPTQRTLAVSHVKAGRLIYIPSATARFEITPSNSGKKQVGEALTIIVSPKPLIANDKLGARAIRLTSAEVETWEKQFAAKLTTYELEGGVGRPMTAREQSAGLNAAEFSQDDPLPQTVYRVTTKPEHPILVTLILPFGQN